MNNILKTMLDKYNPQTIIERDNAIKEIIQEIALSGLSHAGFFEKAAFYGGTCLRIFYGLDRFSEDLDFALYSNVNDFNIEDYFPRLIKEFESYGINVEITHKSKSVNTMVESAFINSNSLTLMLEFFPNLAESKELVFNQKTKIKFEIDIGNPCGGTIERKYMLLPSPYEACVFSESTLFSGKLAALLCRNYKNNVKGRDYYDYLFYVSKGAKINLKYLEEKLKKNLKIEEAETLTLDAVKALLKDRFISVDYNMAINDVSRFINNTEKLKLWSSDLFISTLENLKAE